MACPGNHSRYVVSNVKNIIGISAGHDHFNDYEGKLFDIKLFYGRKTGYAGIGPEPFFNKGARVFEYNFSTKTLNS